MFFLFFVFFLLFFFIPSIQQRSNRQQLSRYLLQSLKKFPGVFTELLVVSSFLVCLYILLAAMGDSRRKFVVDCDAGVDDAQAILMAVSQRDVNILAVTSVFGNAHVDHTSINCLRVLKCCGRLDVRTQDLLRCTVVHVVLLAKILLFCIFLFQRI